MKKYRWPEKGVDYELVSQGEMVLFPQPSRLSHIAKDHDEAISGGMFFSTPDSFDDIVARLSEIQRKFNNQNSHS